jgi:hypothetical protein
MMRKSTLVLIIVISALMFYTGCDDNDGGGGQAAPTPTPTGSPPPGGGAPPPEACDNCPCDYFSVPMTAECWVSDDTGPSFDPGEEVPGERCSLFPADLGFGNGLVVFLGIAFACPQGQACCRILGLNSDTCPVPNETFELSIDNIAQVRDCQACLQEYATELDNMGMGIPVANPPYECITQQ